MPIESKSSSPSNNNHSNAPIEQCAWISQARFYVRMYVLLLARTRSRMLWQIVYDVVVVVGVLLWVACPWREREGKNKNESNGMMWYPKWQSYGRALMNIFKYGKKGLKYNGPHPKTFQNNTISNSPQMQGREKSSHTTSTSNLPKSH